MRCVGLYHHGILNSINIQQYVVRCVFHCTEETGDKRACACCKQVGNNLDGTEHGKRQSQLIYYYLVSHGASYADPEGIFTYIPVSSTASGVRTCSRNSYRVFKIFY